MQDLRQRTGYLFLAVIVGHVILISAQVRRPSGVGVLDSVVFTAFSEVQRAFYGLIDGVRGGWSGYVALRQTQSENESLRHDLTRLRVQLQEERALGARSRQLARLLDARSATRLPTTAATIISADPTLWFQTVTINKGEQHGLRPNQAVVAADGVVGRTFGTVAPRAARVQLLIDSNAAAGALIERTRVGGVVHGAGGDLPLQLDYVSNLADVLVGDRVVTSGIDGIYPKGFVIGEIEATATGPGLYLRITVRPAVEFSALEEVLVILERGDVSEEAGESAAEAEDGEETGAAPESTT